MQRFSSLAKRFVSWSPALVMAAALMAGCGQPQDEGADQQGLGDHQADGTGGGAADGCSAPGDCFTCSDLLEAPCLCKDAAGAEIPCRGAALEACKANHEQEYQQCLRQETCERTVLTPKLAQCPAKQRPGHEACVQEAYAAYAACVGTGGGGGGGGTSP